MRDFLALIGISFITVMFFMLAYLTYVGIKELIVKLRWQHKYKHRFDKPPMAKCYCRDCKKYGDETNRCYKFDGWHVADNWFCWDAEPREKDPKED